MKPEVSVVIPVFNEADNIEPLAREIAGALAGRAFEILYIDDGSTDATAATVLRKPSTPARQALAANMSAATIFHVVRDSLMTLYRIQFELY